jgi:hypothetical protein
MCVENHYRLMNIIKPPTWTKRRSLFVPTNVIKNILVIGGKAGEYL